ncbi:MAG: Fe(3+) ABC transporter substrate-binding protein [Thermosynechococcaceae cyanobacterium]
MPNPKSMGVSLLSGLMLIALWGCSNQKLSQQVVNVYSSRHYDTDQLLYDEFTQETSIKVNIVEGKDDEILERIKNEGANTQADVLVMVDAGRLWRAEKANLLQSTTSSVLDEKIPASLRHPKGLWFGLTRRARVIVYNKARVKPDEVSTYEDLAQPKWKGRVCVRSSSNVYNQSLLGSMIESQGVAKTEAWAKGLVRNLARPPEGGDSTQIKAVAAGQCDVALVNHYYAARLADSQKPEDQDVTAKISVLFPNQGDRGTHVNISGAGVVVNAPHQANAVKFLEYLVSPEAQTIFADSNNEYPVVQGIKNSKIINTYGEFKADTVNVSAYGRNNPEAIKIADRAGWK